MTDPIAENLLRLRMARPADPMLTFYDDATGARVELSAVSFANWVAKTANLLVDGLGAAPRDRVVLLLPTHWQTAVWLFACWSAGLVAVPAHPDRLPGGPPPAVTAAAPGALAAAAGTGALDLVGLSLDPLGGPLPDPAAGVVDYAVEVRAYGDTFTAAADPGWPALDIEVNQEDPGRVLLNGTELLARVRDAGRRWGYGEGDRTLALVDGIDLERLLAGLLAPLAAGGSVVMSVNTDPSRVERRRSQERVTMTVSDIAGMCNVHRTA